jgi:gas vesicle protein
MELKPAFDALGPYPILQFFAALIIFTVFAIGGIAWLKGEKFAKAEAMKPLDAPRSPEAATQLFFDGPLKAIFDTMHEIQTAQSLNKLELKDMVAQLLSQNKGAVIDAIAQAQTELQADMENVKRELHSRHEQDAAQLREMRDILVRMEANMLRRRS